MKQLLEITGLEMSELVMWGITWILLVMVVLCMIRLLVRVKQMKKSIDITTRRVEKYVDYILADDGAKESEQAVNNGQAQNHPKQERKLAEEAKLQESEEQNHLISSVLQEIFP